MGAVPARLGSVGLARSLLEGQPPFGAPRPSFLDLLRTILFSNQLRILTPSQHREHLTVLKKRPRCVLYSALLWFCKHGRARSSAYTGSPTTRTPQLPPKPWGPGLFGVLPSLGQQDPAPLPVAQLVPQTRRCYSIFPKAPETPLALVSTWPPSQVPSGTYPEDQPVMVRKGHRKEERMKALERPFLPEETVTRVPGPQRSMP